MEAEKTVVTPKILNQFNSDKDFKEYVSEAYIFEFEDTFSFMQFRTLLEFNHIAYEDNVSEQTITIKEI